MHKWKWVIAFFGVLTTICKPIFFVIDRLAEIDFMNTYLGTIGHFLETGWGTLATVTGGMSIIAWAVYLGLKERRPVHIHHVHMQDKITIGSSDPPTVDDANVSTPIRKSKIDVCSGAQYEVSDISHGHILSTVKIGIKNSGDGHLSNCKVYIDNICPMPEPFYGGVPLLLDGSGFTLRNDDPEKLVDVASQWSHINKYRFHGPIGGFAESLNYIDDHIERNIIIKVIASECQRRSSFKSWTDEAKCLHLRNVCI